MTERALKGKSLIDFPAECIVIDLETTGLSALWDSIIEIGAVRYKGEKEVDKFETLVQPGEARYGGRYVDSYIEELTGITHEMLVDAPPAASALREFRAYLGDALLVGHNINFDVNMLYDSFDKYDIEPPLSNDFVDTLRIARKLYPGESNRLPDMAARFGISDSGAHRAVYDCTVTHECLERLRADALKKYPDLDAFKSAFADRKRRHAPRYHFAADRITDVKMSEGVPDETHPLYGKVCVFTGALERMTRDAAMQIVDNFGGINGKSVTKKTNYLILGNVSYLSNIKDGKSNKLKKAEQMRLAGRDIEIISENEFLDMINI